MGLEVAPFVQDLVATNPISGDDVNQGDDHIRLLKTTLKATFPSATKALYAAVASAETASFTVVAADENTTFMVTTAAGAVVATLPTLLAADHGWSCFFIKMDTTNTFHVASASGSVYSGPTLVTRARRCIAGVRFGAYWSGSNWLIERCEKAPVGTLLPFAGAALPAGYEWPNGQIFASFAANYPEYTAVVSGTGNTPDVRGRAPFGRSNMGGVDSGFLPSVPGTSLWQWGGAETLAISQANLPSVTWSDTLTFAGSGSGTLGTVSQSSSGFINWQHDHAGSSVALGTTASSTTPSIAVNAVTTGPTTVTVPNFSSDHSHSYSFTPAGTINGSVTSGGSGTAYNKLPPAIIMNFILVVE